MESLFRGPFLLLKTKKTVQEKLFVKTKSLQFETIFDSVSGERVLTITQWGFR